MRQNPDLLKPRTPSSTADATRPERMRWWHEARFGMFVHWGLYSQLGQSEWAMNLDRIPIPEYEPLADSWHPKPGAAREWAALAKAAGMKYMVLTTKHHEGFCLWDTRQTDYNAVKRGPKRDVVREYVEACREFGLKVGGGALSCVSPPRQEPATPERYHSFPWWSHGGNGSSGTGLTPLATMNRRTFNPKGT